MIFNLSPERARRKSELERLIAMRLPRDQIADNMSISIARVRNLADMWGLILPYQERKPRRRNDPPE